MRLFVRVIEARNLLPMDSNGFSDPYVKLQLGRQKHKTKVIKMNLNPTWDQEFSFEVGNLHDVLKVRVFDEDMLGMDDFLGLLDVPVEGVFEAENFSFGVRWFRLLPKNKHENEKDCGEICLEISLSQRDKQDREFQRSLSDDFIRPEVTREISLSSQNTDTAALSGYDEVEASRDDESNEHVDDNGGLKEEKIDRPSNAIESVNEERPNDLVEQSTSSDTDVVENATSNASFEELLRAFESAHQGTEMPANLPGGILVDQCYAVSPTELNTILFSPTSSFRQSVADAQCITGLQVGAWAIEDNKEKLARTLIFTTAPSKLVKAVQATEEQTYLKADGEGYSVLTSVSTPDVPCGSCFKTEVLFCITPGAALAAEECTTSRLLITWRMNFLQSVMIKGMIENGAKQGLKDSYLKFTELLAQIVKPVDVDGAERPPSIAQAEPESLWKLARLYLGNFSFILSVLAAIYMLVHLFLARHSTLKGLEFKGLDLPDSFSEILIGGLLVLQGQRIYKKMTRFIHATERRVGDHGAKAKGDGWLLTICLVEGTKLAPVDQTGYSDPHVVFTCNGKTKRSSIKFQTLEPQWNEIFEFDAMDDPPSMMNIDVFDFDGPFDELTPLGHAEINFLKLNISELSDVWVPLQGKLAQAWQSKLHLRIFLKNSKGSHGDPDFFDRMGKELGTKITMRSPQTNFEFQKIFSLPAEEFLISDFNCSLRRKMATQGRLFLSPRIIGFYSSIFGQKIKFFFLWEDIEDIQVGTPNMGSMWSSVLVIILRQGRGMDARDCARSMEDGKLRFHLQSFSSFSVAKRTVMALWEARSLSPEMKLKIAAGESDGKVLQSEESGSFFSIDSAKNVEMSEVHSSCIPAELASLMAMFDGGAAEKRVMEKVGCLEYSVTQWDAASASKPDVQQRQIHYRFDKKLSPTGGEVTSSQQKSPLPGPRKGWLIEEVMELQGVLFADFFTIRVRYQLDEQAAAAAAAGKKKACGVQVSLGIEWLKETKHQKKVAKSVLSATAARVKSMLGEAGKELKQA